jgi:hypothetical protein
MSDQPIKCSNVDCKVAETGKCVEGLELATCPNYGKSREPTKTDAGSDDGPPHQPTQQLGRSNVLDVVDGSQVLAMRPSRVVAVIGTVDAGKTSLIASLYDAFQRAPVGGIRFAGSSTLQSFEVACHDSRSASRREEAHIFRTPHGDARFYHLDIQEENASEITSLLISDRAGEEYWMVSREVVHAANLFEVHRADTVTVLVDGDRLTSTLERHNVRAEVDSILQGLADGDALNGRQRLAVVLTKRDAVLASDHRDRAQRDFGRLVRDLRTNLSGRFEEIEPFETAASPKKSGVTRGEGIPALLKFWLKPVVVPRAISEAIVPLRDFGRLSPMTES